MASGNATAAHLLIALAKQTGEQVYLRRSLSLFQTFSSEVHEDPGRFVSLVAALDEYLNTDWSGLPSEPKGTKERASAISTGDSFFEELNDFRFEPDRSVVRGKLSIAPIGRSDKGKYEAVIDVQIEKGWHINGAGTADADLIPTSVVFSADREIEVLSVRYPTSITKSFPFADRPLDVYEGGLEIRAQLRVPPVAPGVTAAVLRCVVSFQACSDAVCLKPEELVLSVPLDE